VEIEQPNKKENPNMIMLVIAVITAFLSALYFIYQYRLEISRDSRRRI
jgi:hypothetical protein